MDLGEGVMLLTEKEARKNWCPHVRTQWISREVGPFADVSEARQVLADTSGPRCATTKCMGWRFTDQHAYAISTDDNGKKTRRRVYKGYCGLAGRP